MKKTKNQPDPGSFKDLVQKSNPEYIQDFIMNSRTKGWKHSTLSGEKGIEYLTEFYTEPDALLHINTLLRDVHHLKTDVTKSKMTVVMSTQNTRIEAKGDNIHGSDFIYLINKQNGFVYVDKQSKCYFEMVTEQYIKHSFNEKLRATVSISNNQTEKNAEINIESPWNLKYKLTLDTNKKWEKYRKDIVCMLIGCSDLYEKSGLDLSEIIHTGIPVKGEVFMKYDDNEWKKMSGFIVKDLKEITVDNTTFKIPEGYRNVRNIVRSEKEKSKQRPFGKPVRLRDYRQRINIRYRPGSWNFEMPPGMSDPNIDDSKETDFGDKAGVTFRAARSDLKIPSCFNEAYGALLANVIDQKTLDDLKFIINGVTKRLTGFSGSSGNLNIGWMAQFKAHANSLNDTDPGGGLYEILHDEADLSFLHEQKLGLLDKLAISTLRKRMADGDQLLDLSLDPALQLAVNNIIANISVDRNIRFDSLLLSQQGKLIDAYVIKGIGELKLNYPSSTGTQTIYYGLLNVRLDDIAFDLNINNKAIIDTFQFDNTGIQLVINLPDTGGKAWHSRWPTAKYWGIVGLSAITCFLVPFTCTLMALAVLVGIFLALDLAYVTLSLKNLKIDSHITLEPGINNILQPKAEVNIDADVSAFYISVIPTGVHQIASLIYYIVLNATDLAINKIEDELESKLNKYLRDDLKIIYPPQFGPVPLASVSNNTEYISEDRGYVEQSLNAGIMGLINPYVTQIDVNVKPNILALRDDFKSKYKDPVTAFNDASSGATATFAKLVLWSRADMSSVARYYTGTEISQNLINTYIYTLWRNLGFNYQFTDEEKDKLIEYLEIAFPLYNGVEGKYVIAGLHPAVPPRTILTPVSQSEGGYYAMTFFDDLRLCLFFRQAAYDEMNRIEFAFSAQVVSEIGFGGFNESTGKLDLLKASDRVLDIYFDMATIKVKVIHPETQYFVYPNMSPLVKVDYSPLNLLQEMFALVTEFSLARRNNKFIPRTSTDPIYVQRYSLGSDAFSVVFQLVPFRGNLYVSKGLGGTGTAIYDGALNIDTLNKEIARIILRAI